jgi:hypothetical protein
MSVKQNNILLKTKEEIITEMYSNKQINQTLSSNIPPSFRDDFKNELFLTLLEKSESHIQNIYYYGSLVGYIKSTIWLQKNGYKSKYKFNPSFDVKNHANVLPFIDEIYDREDNFDLSDMELVEAIDKWLDTIHWYSAHLFRCNYMKTIDPLNNELREPMPLRKIEKYHNNKITYSNISIKNKQTMVSLLEYLIDNKLIERKSIRKRWNKLLK